VRTIGLAIIALALMVGAASAACRLTYVNGQPAQLCDSTLDIPAIGVLGPAPIMSPSVPPIASPMIPPIGTSSCHPAQVWNGFAYTWRTVCN
jgi:hypothetical protein